jgi:hypothetical protein
MEMNGKSKNRTLKELWFRQLLSIRGISPEKAETVVQTFPTPALYVFLYFCARYTLLCCSGISRVYKDKDKYCMIELEPFLS